MSDRWNAATWYALASERYQAARMSQAENVALWWLEVDPMRPPDGPLPAVRQFMHRIQPALNLVRIGCHQSECDFGDDPAQGMLMSLDHLTRMRTLDRLLGSDVQLRLCDGDNYGAADRLATMYRMANHPADDGTMVGSVVGSALFAYAERSAELALDYAAIGREEAAMLVRAVQSLEAGDLFGGQRNIANERKRTTQWMLERYAGEGGLEKFAEEQQQIVPGASAELAKKCAAMDQEEFEAALKGSDTMMERLAAAFSNPESTPENTQVELAKIQEAAAVGEFGPLATELVVPYTRTYGPMMKQKGALAARLAQLRGLADGTRDPMDLANAAVWYLRAMALLPRVDPQKFDLVRQYAAVHDAPASEKLVELLDGDEIKVILGLVEQGSRISRCDFSLCAVVWPSVVRRYHPGMRDLARLVTADAARLIHAGGRGSYAKAAERLALAYRMCGHLAKDASVSSALISHFSFRQADALAEAATKAKYIHGEMLEKMQKAVHFRSTDPFGYEAAITRMRQSVDQRIALMMRHEDDAKKKRAAAFAAAASADRLLWLEVVFDEGDEPLERASQHADEWLTNLEKEIDAEAFHDSMAQTTVVREMISKGEFDLVAGVECPIIAKLPAHQKKAFADLKNCLERMKISAK